MVSAGVSVALSNFRTGAGYLGFFTTDSVLQFRGMVRTALAEAGAPRSVRLWYAGAAFVPRGSEYANEVNTKTLAFRRLVAGELDSKGFQLAYGGWLGVGKCLNMALRCGTDRCIISQMDDPYPR